MTTGGRNSYFFFCFLPRPSIYRAQGNNFFFVRLAYQNGSAIAEVCRSSIFSISACVCQLLYGHRRRGRNDIIKGLRVIKQRGEKKLGHGNGCRQVKYRDLLGRYILNISKFLAGLVNRKKTVRFQAVNQVSERTVWGPTVHFHLTLPPAILSTVFACCFWKRNETKKL